MAALLFPGSPAHLATYTDPSQAVWQYDSDNTVWDLITNTTRKVFSGVKAQTSAGFDLTASYVDVPFDTIEFNVDNYFQIVNTKGIAPSTGFYRILVSIFILKVQVLHIRRRYIKTTYRNWERFLLARTKT